MPDGEKDELARLQAMQASIRDQYMVTPPQHQPDHVQKSYSAQPPRGYVCHTCRVPGHWRNDCPHKGNPRAARTPYAFVNTCCETDTGARGKMFYWKLRFEKKHVRHPIQFTGLYLNMGDARSAIAMAISGVKTTVGAEKSRAWKDFTYGNVGIRIFKDAEMTQEYTDTDAMIPAHTLVHCKRVPIHKRERENDLEGGGHFRARQAPTWAANTTAVTAGPGALEREFGWMKTDRITSQPLAIEGLKH